jgi:serine/threonine protein phosphatase PrpC
MLSGVCAAPRGVAACLFWWGSTLIQRIKRAAGAPASPGVTMNETLQQSAPQVARGANIDERSRPRFVAAGGTDRGHFRPRNEDAALVCPELGLFIVADGVSGVTGNEGGAVAAQLAVDHIARVVRAAAPEALLQAPAGVLCGAVQVADRCISEAGKAAGLAQMGTTVAALLVSGPHVLVAHVGDSRAYLLRTGKLERLTVDHTLLAEWEATHACAAPPEVRLRAGHVLTRALGGKRPGVEVEVRAVPWQPGDVFLLSSDGLHGLVGDRAMAEVITGAPDLDRALVRLLRRANDAGGYDNITAVLVRMLGD